VKRNDTHHVQDDDDGFREGLNPSVYCLTGYLIAQPRRVHVQKKFHRAGQKRKARLLVEMSRNPSSFSELSTL
jgi:hypothetical protein